MTFKKWLPTAASVAAILIQLLVVSNGTHPKADADYYLYVSIAGGVIALMCALASLANKG